MTENLVEIATNEPIDDLVPVPGDSKRISRRRLILRRFRRNKPAVVSLVLLVALFIGCYALPPLLPYSYSDLDFYAGRAFTEL